MFAAGEAEELIAIVHRMPPKKRAYLYAIAQGMDPEDAAETAGVKFETVQTNWFYRGKDAQDFDRAVTIIQGNPYALRKLLEYQIEIGALTSLAVEMTTGYYSPKYSRYVQPRAEMVNIAVNGWLANRSGGMSAEGIIITQAVGAAIAGAVQAQLAALQEQRAKELTLTPDMIHEMRETDQ